MKNNNNWKKELDNLLTKMSEEYLIDDEFGKQLEWFITNALNQQRLQIVEMVEIVKFNAKAPDDTLAMTPVERGMWYKAYYQACTDIINKIEFLTKLEK